MGTITKSDELRLYNRSRVLSCLRKQHPLSRTGIKQATGLSSATVTQVTANLIDDDIIEEITAVSETADSQATSRRGRPQVLLDLRAEAATTAVVTLLLNQLEVTLFDYGGHQLYQLSKQTITARLSKRILKEDIKKLIDKALAESKRWKKTLKHICVVYQGTVTSDNSRILWSPITDIRDVNIAELLNQRYGVGVTVVNDCKTIASALYKKDSAWGNHAHNKNFAVVMLSYGVGLGMYYNGSILTGSKSSATEFGHMLLNKDGALCRCGRRGCIEAYASDYAILRKATRTHEHSPPADEVSVEVFSQLIAKAQQKSGPERKAFEAAGAAIGHGLSNLFMLFDPFPVVIVGTSAEAFSLMEGSLHQSLEHFHTADAIDAIHVWDSQSEGSLILEGASGTALAHIDLHVFGFGRDDEESYLLPVAG